MPDDTTAKSEAPAAPAPTVESLQAELKTTRERADVAAKDADQAKRYLVDLVSRIGQDNRVQQQQQEQPAQDASPDELLEEFKNNPVGLLDRHFAARMGPILHDHLDDRAKLNRQYFIDQNKDDWAEYGDEVEAFMQPMSMSTKSRQGSWQEAMNFVKAKHIDAIVDKRIKTRDEAEKKTLVEGRGGFSNRRPVGTYRLTDDEKAVAKGFGMSEKEWIANKTAFERGEADEY